MVDGIGGLADRVFEQIVVVVLFERIAARQHLPRHDAKTVDVGLFVQFQRQHHFGRHPERRAGDRVHIFEFWTRFRFDT